MATQRSRLAVLGFLLERLGKVVRIEELQLSLGAVADWVEALR